MKLSFISLQLRVVDTKMDIAYMGQARTWHSTVIDWQLAPERAARPRSDSSVQFNSIQFFNKSWQNATIQSNDE